MQVIARHGSETLLEGRSVQIICILKVLQYLGPLGPIDLLRYVNVLAADILGDDAANFLLAGIAAGNQDRASLLTYVNDTEFPGITKSVKFEENGNVASLSVYAFTVTDGEIVGVGEIK